MENEKILELMTRMYTDLKVSQEQMRAELTAGQEKMYTDLKVSQEQMRAELTAQGKMYTDLKGSQEQLRAELTAAQGKMYAEMQEGFRTINEKLSSLDARLSFVEKSVVKIEIDHGAKLEALFDGYQLNSEKLDRIESEVARHDDYILRRLK